MIASEDFRDEVAEEDGIRDLAAIFRSPRI
jgi:hypothetical protein